MASGFQQDTNQLSPDFYRVVLTLSGGTGAYNAAAPANGAVNPYNWDSFTTKPSSDANAQRLVAAFYVVPPFRQKDNFDLRLCTVVGDPARFKFKGQLHMKLPIVSCRIQTHCCFYFFEVSIVCISLSTCVFVGVLCQLSDLMRTASLCHGCVLCVPQDWSSLGWARQQSAIHAVRQAHGSDVGAPLSRLPMDNPIPHSTLTCGY